MLHLQLHQIDLSFLGKLEGLHQLGVGSLRGAQRNPQVLRLPLHDPAMATMVSLGHHSVAHLRAQDTQHEAHRQLQRQSILSRDRCTGEGNLCIANCVCSLVDGVRGCLFVGCCRHDGSLPGPRAQGTHKNPIFFTDSTAQCSLGNVSCAWPARCKRAVTPVRRRDVLPSLLGSTWYHKPNFKLNAPRRTWRWTWLL